MNALDYATRLDAFAPADKGYMLNEAAEMLRRQHKAIVELREALAELRDSFDEPSVRKAKQALMSTEEIAK